MIQGGISYMTATSFRGVFLAFSMQVHCCFLVNALLTAELQDLKDRYYSVCRKLVRNRPWAGDEASKAQLISSFQFDKGKVSCFTSLLGGYNLADRELTRKKYLLSLENRTPEQLVEEEALYIEIKRLEQNERRFKRERDELLQTLAGIDSGLPDVIEDESFMNSMVDVKKRKKGFSGMDIDTPSTPVFPVMPAMKRPQSAKSAAYGIQQNPFSQSD
jgi:DNA methyltransferase 1-associated protein 1